MTSNRGLVGVLLLLLVAVLVPTAGVMWFMAVAMRNERAAARQTLTAAFEVQLAALAQQLHTTWQTKKDTLEGIDSDEPAAAIFATLVRSGVVDSVVLYEDNGEPKYPGNPPIRASRRTGTPSGWLEAQRLEFEKHDYLAAARSYGLLAESTKHDDVAARAFQAQARCLGKAGHQSEAIDILLHTVTQDRFRGAQDGHGRLIVPDSLLLALHLIDDPASTEAGNAADDLRARLADYSEPLMPVTQRRFLMGQLETLRPEEPPVDTFAAEELALRYLESDEGTWQGEGLGATGLPNVWRLGARNGTVVALFHEYSVLAAVSAGIGKQPDDHFEVELLPPGFQSQQEPFLAAPAGVLLPGWRLTLHLADEDLVEAVADEAIAGYLWTAALLIGAVVALAVLIARQVSRQMRMAKLKNDLIATVTHELKTPLASMRLLVETLLDGRPHDQQQVREYLELIAKENTRLSRLIEDFLAFSRMERNKQTFMKTEIAPAEVATAAADAVSSRFEGSDCRFDIEIAEGLPMILGDPEALSTVVVNLLDNAYKYTSDDKQIQLRAYRENGNVVFAVQDNGIGLSRGAAKRVFDRFYQADQSLSNSGQGVGLGLAIVKFIVAAHEGQISLVSEPGRGSTFHVSLPAVPETTSTDREDL